MISTTKLSSLPQQREILIFVYKGQHVKICFFGNACSINIYPFYCCTNSPNLELGDEGVNLPQNLQHFSEAISQTKNDIFNAYNEMQKQATGEGITLDPEELAKPLDHIINSKSMQVVSPKTVQYAQAVKERLIGTEPTLGRTSQW